MHSTSDCLRQLAEWIRSGTLASEWAKDPKKVAGHCLGALSFLMGVASRYFHGDVDVIGASDADDQFELGLAVGELAGALGVEGEPGISQGPLSIFVVQMLLKALLDYLLSLEQFSELFVPGSSFFKEDPSDGDAEESPV